MFHDTSWFVQTWKLISKLKNKNLFVEKSRISEDSSERKNNFFKVRTASSLVVEPQKFFFISLVSLHQWKVLLLFFFFFYSTSSLSSPQQFVVLHFFLFLFWKPHNFTTVAKKKNEFLFHFLPSPKFNKFTKLFWFFQVFQPFVEGNHE